jgi:hypothetical protein
MTFWIYFWSFFFFVSVALFTVLAIIVAIGGYYNILSLFKTLTARRAHEDETSAGKCE